MGYYCCVPLCNSNSKRKNGISFHGFTKDRQLRVKWLQNIRRDVNSKTNPFRINHHTKICSLHFLKSDFKIASEKWRLKPNAVPTIFAWTNRKPKRNVIRIPSFVPKPINGDETEKNDPEEMVIKIENTESIAENQIFDETPPPSPAPPKMNDETAKNEDYKEMYIALLKENCYLKNELETLNYKYKDQEELYENLVVVNKTTQKENTELRHTVAILQACLKKTTVFHEPSTIYLAQHNDKLLIQQQQQFQQQYQQLLQHQHQLQLMQNRQMQQNYQIVQSKEKNFIELQKAVCGRGVETYGKKKNEYGEENMLQKLLEKSCRDDGRKRRGSVEGGYGKHTRVEELGKKGRTEGGDKGSKCITETIVGSNIKEVKLDQFVDVKESKDLEGVGIKKVLEEVAVNSSGKETKVKLDVGDVKESKGLEGVGIGKVLKEVGVNNSGKEIGINNDKNEMKDGGLIATNKDVIIVKESENIEVKDNKEITEVENKTILERIEENGIEQDVTNKIHTENSVDDTTEEKTENLKVVDIMEEKDSLKDATKSEINITENNKILDDIKNKNLIGDEKIIEEIKN